MTQEKYSPEFQALLATAATEYGAFAVIGYIEATCRSAFIKPKDKVRKILDVIEAYDTERERLRKIVEEP